MSVYVYPKPMSPRRRRIVQRRIKRRDAMFRFVEQVKNERGCALAVMRWNQEHKRTTRFPLELDHIVPRYLGGRPAIHFTRGLRGRRRDWVLVWWFLIHPNIQVLCHTCHQAKDKNGGR